VLHRVKEERNILLQTVKRKKANWIGHILHRSCFLEHNIGGGDSSNGMMRKMSAAAG